MTVKQLKEPFNIDTKNLNCDLAIVGGGIVGATLASALSNSGLKIIIIEARPLEVAAAKQQAYAFSLLSSRIYQGIGVWEEIYPYVGKFNCINLSDGDYHQQVRFDTQDLKTNHLGFVAQHNVVLTALQKYIAGCGNINWLCPAEVIDIQNNDDYSTVEVKVNGKSQLIKTKLIVGADGARSQIRSLAGITTRGWKYWQSCVAFTIEHNAPKNDTAFERFCFTGPMGVLPLPENRCQIVWTNPHAEAKALQELDEAEFLERLKPRLGGVLGEIKLVSDRFLFPVQLMQCDRYVQPRLALVGDAAHCCHPVGGQGLNMGIRDAASLAEILIAANNKGLDLGDIKVLKPYERWRRLENFVILGFTDFLDRMFSNKILPLVLLRRWGLWIMSYFQPMKIFFLKLMTGLKGKTPQLAQR